MTTIRDLLNDFIEEVYVKAKQFDGDEEGTQTWVEIKEELLDEYIDIIKERIVG